MNMEKKENEVEIATNMSSGAEKVENIGERADAKAGAAGAVNAAGGKAETKKAPGGMNSPIMCGQYKKEPRV